VARRRDACRAVDLEANVPILGQFRFSRVEADSNANRPSFQLSLSGMRTLNRLPGIAERKEEGVALVIDLDSAPGGKRFS
jgi:hypothetical protein